jgi:hypothetical protein
MNIRKEKESEFFIHHLETFKKLQLSTPFFTIKTAFFQKGKFGRQVQFFEWELKKGEDIYIEFYDKVVNSANELVDIVPMNEDRALFKYKFNPFYAEEYETKEGTNTSGEPYIMYTVPVNELIVITLDGQEITHALYEKRKADAEKDPLPKLQNKVTPNVFPDFELDTAPKKELELDYQNNEIADAPLSELTIRDLAAIMLMKPVSAKPWLNELVNSKDKAPWE